MYFCVPPLPSKRAELNRKSLYFIRLIREELIPSNFGVTLVDGFDGFLDQAGLLSQNLSRDLNRHRKPDYLHLNWKGLAKLGVLIRNTILLRMVGSTNEDHNLEVETTLNHTQLRDTPELLPMGLVIIMTGISHDCSEQRGMSCLCQNYQNEPNYH